MGQQQFKLGGTVSRTAYLISILPIGRVIIMLLLHGGYTKPGFL
jgi:hypothetical protein